MTAIRQRTVHSEAKLPRCIADPFLEPVVYRGGQSLVHVEDWDSSDICSPRATESVTVGDGDATTSFAASAVILKELAAKDSSCKSIGNDRSYLERKAAADDQMSAQRQDLQEDQQSTNVDATSTAVVPAIGTSSRRLHDLPPLVAPSGRRLLSPAEARAKIQQIGENMRQVYGPTEYGVRRYRAFEGYPDAQFEGSAMPPS